MDIKTKTEIIDLVRERGPISSQTISDFLEIEKSEIYTFLTSCAKHNMVKRTSGIDGENTMVFHWSLTSEDIGDLSAI